MQWSYPILRVAGTEIRIHLTFLLLLTWIGIAYYQDGGAAAALEGVGFIVAVFACVVLHEFGHATAARRYGIRTPKITLLRSAASLNSSACRRSRARRSSSPSPARWSTSSSPRS